MRRQSLSFDNLGEVLSSAKNAAKLGQQQFETPVEVAKALMLPLPRIRPVICDLECGHGALLTAACNESTLSLLGLDIDPTACALPRGSDSLASQRVIKGDLNRLAPLLWEVGFATDLLVLNPPFSLKWPEGDSTLVTWKLANEFLTPRGEGMMICNQSTAQRLIAPTAESSRIWLWVTLPNFFPGTVSNMEIAVLYFARDHQPNPGDRWIDLRLHSAMPDAIADSLEQFVGSRHRHILGQTVRTAYHACSTSPQTWDVVAQEWKRIIDEESGRRQGWNIRLDDDGCIEAWLTTFQRISAAVPRTLAEELQSLHRKHPSALVVQKPSRIALQRAVTGGVWRVHPAVIEAVEQAVREYNANRAPFTRLNDVQRLAYLDEEDMIECRAALDGFIPGTRYPLLTETFEGRKTETRSRGRHHDDEVVLVTGQELAIIVIDEDSRRHCFTQFPPTDEDQRPAAVAHHLLPDLLAHFVVPEVPDVAAVNSRRYHEYKDRLLALEA